ncbi:MAG: ATP-dependent DNA helicase [Methyloceanibacter sp.]|uniref:ATP-dependent DNA helicase n=1 Tax=Methyloceanibacter sp. TaxID=1965321 RepID=UPI003D6D93AD
MTQDEALALLKTGASVFLTGQPGSGKTHTVNRYLRELQRLDIAYAYTASTGIAATHGHGVTIHAWSGIGVREALSRRDLDLLAANRRLTSRIEKTSVLVIDEISMLPARSLTLVDAVCRHIKGIPSPFGGLQVVLVGDFFQLPPVVRRGAQPALLPEADGANAFGSEFAHASAAWRDLSPTVCYLSEQHRQTDKPFLEVLAAIRANACAGIHRERLAERLVGNDPPPEGCTRLFTHNAAVDDINRQQLAKLGGKTHVFTMLAKGADHFVQALKRGCLSPETLELKHEAVVMFTKNDPAGRFVNGTLGVVETFDTDDGYPLVRTRGGKRIMAEPAVWKIEEAGKERASIAQVPLRLAWAMTVHKSQGMSLDTAVIDLSRAFEYGQGYVALSRLRSLSGLHLLGLNERALRVHPLAVEKDAEFGAASAAARRASGGVDALTSKQAAFLAACQARPPSAEPKRPRRSAYPKSYEVAALRETHAKAYAPWTMAEENDLALRHHKGEPIDSIAAALGRKLGAIRSRLKKLGLI